MGHDIGKYNEKKILNAIIDAFPDGTYFQGRYMRVVNQTDKNLNSEYVRSEERRVGKECRV